MVRVRRRKEPRLMWISSYKRAGDHSKEATFWFGVSESKFGGKMLRMGYTLGRVEGGRVVERQSFPSVWLDARALGWLIDFLGEVRLELVRQQGRA